MNNIEKDQNIFPAALNGATELLRKRSNIYPIKRAVVGLGETALKVAEIASNLTRKVTHEDLRREAEGYREIVENLPDVVFSLDAQGIIVYISPIVEQVSGYKISELIGQPFEKFVSVDDLPKLLGNSRVVMAVENGPVEFKVLDKDGALRWVRASSRISLVNGEEPLITGTVADINAQKLSQEALERSESLYRKLVDQSPISIEHYDKDCKLERVNPASLELFGLMDRTDISKLSIFDGQTLSEDLKRDLLAGKQIRYEAVFDFDKVDYATSKSGHVWLDIVFSPIIDNQSGEVNGYLLQAQDITQRKDLEKELNEKAAHDPLTGLSNRRSYLEQLDELQKKLIWTKEGERRKYNMPPTEAVGVICFDLNNLKSVNDNYTHEAGDILIIDFANVLKQSFREMDFVGRLGGDEFTVLFSSKSIQEAKDILNATIARVKNKLDELNAQRHKRTYAINQNTGEKTPLPAVEVAIGAAIAGVDDDLKNVVNLADTRMYDNKKTKLSPTEFLADDKRATKLS